MARTRVGGKGPLPMADEYTGAVAFKGVGAFLAEYAASLLSTSGPRGVEVPLESRAELAMYIPPAPSRLWTDCPERPLVGFMKFLQRELGTNMRDSPCYDAST